VTSLTCTLSSVLTGLIKVYILLLLTYIIVASFLPGLRGRWFSYVEMLVEPVLLPLRRIIPPLGGLDLSFLVLFLGLQLLMRAVLQATPLTCSFSRGLF
jgi:YggT family protein